MMRIVYMGTPEFAVNPLKKLDDNYDVVMVVTQPDKEVGRKKEIKYSEVKKYALDHGIEVFQPEKIRLDYQNVLDANPDVIITCAYGQIIPKEILDYPKYKCINIHASLLPKLRGGAPIHWSIINGDSKTGITIMYMNEKMDEGDILYQEEVEILDTDNVETLHDKLSVLGSKMIIDFIPRLESGDFTAIKQNNEEATYGYNVTRGDEHIDFNKTSREIFNRVRGLNPWPVAYTTLDGKVFKIYSSRISDKNPSGDNGEITNIYPDGIGVKTSDGEIIITEIKEEGKNRILVKDYLNGIHDKDSLLHKIFS
ncbi:MAG: methionyl-tRNA formyltransferase [Bacilli bacterium]|nr:methionyl-tRNA formyltransferase [Bacilli bacterium]